LLVVNYLVENNFLRTVADVVHSANLLDFIGRFQFLRNAFIFSQLLCQLVIHIQCISVDILEILFKRAFHPHDVDNCRGVLFQIAIVSLSVCPYVLYKFLTQWDVNLIVNHIHSTPRESLGGSNPYSVARETLGEDLLNAFQLRLIEPDEVTLTPKLIRYN